MKLDHIAIAVTNRERSARFYRDILRMTLQEPIDLKETTPLLKFGHTLLSSGPKGLQNLAKSACGHAYESMFTTVTSCSAGSSQNGLIMVEQRNPETNQTRSVTGNTLFGFSCFLSPEVDMEDLAWDLEIADQNFLFGDTGTDGSIFTPDQEHSIFLRDPDGRMIELISGTEDGAFITRIAYPMIYVRDIQKSSAYYQSTFGLKELGGAEYEKAGTHIRVLNLGEEEPVIRLYEVTKPDGERELSGGFGLDHIALSGGTEPKSPPLKNPPCVRVGPDKKNWYALDSDGYCLEFCR